MFEPTWFMPLYGVLLLAGLGVIIIAIVQGLLRSQAEHLVWWSKPMTLPEKMGATIVTLCFLMTLYNAFPLWWPWMMARAPWSWVVALVLFVFLGYTCLSDK